MVIPAAKIKLACRSQPCRALPVKDRVRNLSSSADFILEPDEQAVVTADRSCNAVKLFIGILHCTAIDALQIREHPNALSNLIEPVLVHRNQLPHPRKRHDVE